MHHTRITALTVLNAGTALALISCSGSDATTTALLGSPDYGKTTILARPSTLPDDGLTSSLILVQLRDTSGAVYPHSVGPISLQASRGTISLISDRGDGQYTALFTPPIRPTGAVVMSAFLAGGQFIASVPADTIVPGPVSLVYSTMTVADAVLPADGAATTLVSVLLLDGNLNPTPSAGASVALRSTIGTLSALSPAGPGVYTAILTAPSQGGVDTVTAIVNGQVLTTQSTIRFLRVGVASAAMSSLYVNVNEVTADGSSIAGITIVLRDSLGNLASNAGETVVLRSTLGTIGQATPYGQTDFLAFITTTRRLGVDTITATLNGRPLNPGYLLFIPGPLATFAFSSVGGGPIPDQTAGQPFVIEIAAQDVFGNTIPSFDGAVTLASNGTLSEGGGTTGYFSAGILDVNVAFASGGTFGIGANLTYRTICPPHLPVPCTPRTITVSGSSPPIIVSP